MSPSWLDGHPELKFSDGFNIDYYSYIIDEETPGGVQTINTDNVYQIAISDVINPL